MKVLCSAVHVAAGTVGASAISGPLSAHVERCDTCAGEIRDLEEVSIQLRLLEPATFRAPDSLYRDVTGSLGPFAVPDLDPRSSLRVPVAAAFVATAAAGTVVIIRMRRQRAA
ncbi:MAG: hypothetical protein O3B42_06850 [Actinomycetota bacterium]|nr:hypothetical protein [Actinomycetota bacterium]